MSKRTSPYTICCDFDGVLATYDGWRGFDVLGEPNYSVIELLKMLKAKGWRVVIFTTRCATPTLEKWLQDYGVPYDDINRNAHNPVCTSVKPIYDIILDDRAVNYHGQDTVTLLTEIDKVMEKPIEPTKGG